MNPDHKRVLPLRTRQLSLALWSTWLLSAPGIVVGLYVLYVYEWEQGRMPSFNKLSRSDYGLQLFVWLTLVGSAAFITILPATVSIVFLWISKRASLPKKIGGSVAGLCAWIGILMMQILK